MHDPPILLLDEPDTGLDLAAADLLNGLMRDERGRRRTVLLTTHNLERARELADRVVVLARGRVVRDQPADAATAAEIVAAVRGDGVGR